MTDLRLAWDPILERADFVRVGAGFATDEDLETAVVVSLFSDRLAAAADPLPSGSNRRGWWGDSFAPSAGDHIGSRLWLLHRAKSTDQTPLIAKGYIAEALQWLLDDGVAAKLDIATFFLSGNRAKLGAVVTIWRQTGPALALRFAPLWDALGQGVIPAAAAVL